MRIGMIGMSEGNGHPFSFSAIINGYDDDGFARSGWPVIHAYLGKRSPEEFGIGDARVTHVWTQDRAVSERLAAACKVERIVDRPQDMIGEVDAVIVARDDVESHRDLALPFLEKGLPVFVDKPLAVLSEELEEFRPYLENGQLMSCSGLRFARELDPARDDMPSFGKLLRIDGVVVKGWQTYGIHMLDAAFGLTSARPVSVQRAAANHDALMIGLDDGSLLTIAALGDSAPCFQLSVFGSKRDAHFSLRDNFSAFRRTLERFVDMVSTRQPPIPPRDTLIGMRTIAAGLVARPGGEALKIEMDGPLVAN